MAARALQRPGRRPVPSNINDLWYMPRAAGTTAGRAGPIEARRAPENAPRARSENAQAPDAGERAGGLGKV